jgi:cytoskeleton protein RodZ
MEQVNQDARVVLRALETSWIRIASESGDYLRSRTLEPGDVFLVPNRDDLELWTGNAGGLELVVDGERIPPLGAAGTIVRDISLAPAALRTPEGPAGG